MTHSGAHSAAGVVGVSTTSKRGSRIFRMTKSGTLQLSPTDLENAAASALAGAADGATFLTLATEGGLEHLFIVDDLPGQEGVAFSVARAMAAHSDEVDQVPDLTQVGGIARLLFRVGTAPLQDTQAGADFSALSRIIGDMLKPGEWVAVSTRKAKQRTEVRWQAQWLDYHGMRTHHSRKSGAPVAQFWAGAHTPARANEVLMRAASAIPGFGLSVRTQTVSTRRPALMWMLFAVIASVISWSGFALAALPAAGASAAVAATVLTAIGVLTWRGYLPSLWRTVRRGLPLARLPRAPIRLSRPKPPQAAKSATTVGRDGGVVVTEQGSFDGDYPLAPSAFLVGAHIPLAFVAPHTGAASGNSSTMARVAPSELRERIGPPIGINHDAMTYLSAMDLWAGLALLGLPGSGKTAFMEHLWGVMCAERVRPSGAVGFPQQHALIAFDTKGDGIASQQYARWSEHTGDRALVVQTADPTDPIGIDLFPDMGIGATAWARQVTNALMYIWGADSIGPRSFDTLTRVLAAAKLVTPAISDRVTVRRLTPGSSPFYFANVLLTNLGDEAGIELAAAIADAAAAPGADPELADVVAELAPVYGPGRTASQRNGLVDAPRTKVAALMAAEHWWSRPKQTTWKALLENNIAVIVNTGASPSGLLPDDKLRMDLSGLLLYTLAEEIKRTCIGWFEKGRAVSVFSDEVKHIAAASAEVITWMRYDARANGVRAVFATQTPETLAPPVRAAILGFGTLMMYAQNDAKTVSELVTDLKLSGGQWDSSDISNLGQYEAIVRATAGGRRLEPFTVTVPDYRGQRDSRSWVWDLAA